MNDEFYLKKGYDKITNNMFIAFLLINKQEGYLYMSIEKLVIDEDKSNSLMIKTKILIQEIATGIIEIFENSSIEEMLNNGSVEKLHKYMLYPQKSFKENKHGKVIIEYTDSIGLLKNYYSSDPFGKPYKAHIKSIQEKANADFAYNKFKNDYDKQEAEERGILGTLLEERNSGVGHIIDYADMGNVITYIEWMRKYLNSFLGYRIQVLSEYDERMLDPQISTRIDKYFTDLTNLRKQCFTTNEILSEYRFGENTYYVQNNGNDDLGMLITDMAHRWDAGIKYLRQENRNHAFVDFLEKCISNMDVVTEYEDLRQQLIESPHESTEESMIYMQIIYLLYPQISGIIWKGRRHSESYFASIVLQFLSRHIGDQSFEEKLKKLKDRIVETEKPNSYGEVKGLGINAFSMCKKRILSCYFEGQNDFKGSKLAKTFENNVVSSVQVLKDNREYEELGEAEKKQARDCYDSVIVSILELTAYMKDKATYMLPVSIDGNKPPVFQTPNEFKNYFVKYINNVELDTAVEFVNRIRDDINLKWWIENYDAFAGEDA